MPPAAAKRSAGEPTTLAALLAEYGGQGWELVSEGPTRLLWKRPMTAGTVETR